MKKFCTIQLKAAFLLIIFSLNIFVGFACSIGIDMGFNAPQHVEVESKTQHTHTHAHKHDSNTGIDHHAAYKTHDHKTNHTKKEEKKGCCNDEVQKVQQLDKNINSSVKRTTVLYTTLLPLSFFQTNIVQPLRTNIFKFRERFFYPPPPNILVEFQRFQI